MYPSFFDEVLDALALCIDKEMIVDLSYCACMLFLDPEIVPQSQINLARERLSRILDEG